MNQVEPAYNAAGERAVRGVIAQGIAAGGNDAVDLFGRQAETRRNDFEFGGSRRIELIETDAADKEFHVMTVPAGRAPYLARSAADRPQRHLTSEPCQSCMMPLNAVKLWLTLASIAVSAAALTSSTPDGPSIVLIQSPATPVLASTTRNSPRRSLTACCGDSGHKAYPPKAARW